jgi:hypothetical protein
VADKKAAEIVAEIVDLLTPVESAERLRIIQASLTLLGESGAVGSRPSVGNGAGDGDGGELLGLPVRARSWMKQHLVSMDELQQVFHLENGAADVIAGDIPGKNKKEKTLNAYILTGLGRLLSTGTAAFDDKSARSLCVSSGCYDESNHSATIKDKGSEFTGNKDGGWTLTAPGLKRAAALVKEVAKG